MNTISPIFEQMQKAVPRYLQIEVDTEFGIADCIYSKMVARGLSKKQFAEAIGHRPCDVTRWLSGQHNFTIATLAKISDFFGEPIIVVPKPANAIERPISQRSAPKKRKQTTKKE